MSLEPGSKVGPYEIRGMLGAGGMGEVYLARDGRLGRDVAVKVLPAAIASDEAALARFEREARAVAALAHPNIVAIYDLGTDGDRAYAAMERLEGETLRDRLGQGPLPVRKAVVLARQIARGLGAAHERGIVHRDLKPENIFLTRDGHAKILDFGLAAERSAVDGTAPDGATATRTSLTAPGTVMGTVGYMAPEQVRGEPVDHRADIFAFGSVLYEMVTGVRAFDRDTGAETMTAILREEPEPVASRASEVSPTLERVIERCLEKNRDERFQSARDLAFAIDTSGSVSGARPVAAAADAVPARPRSIRPWVVGAAGLLLGLALGSVLVPRGAGGGEAGGEPVRVRALTTSGRDSEPTASPDGQLVAFRSTRDGTPRIWVRQMAGGGEQPLTAGPDVAPRFSPDGSTLLFLRDEGEITSIYRQAFVGGRAKKLVRNAVEGAWSPDGSRIAFVRTESAQGVLRSAVGLADAQAGGGEILTTFDAFVGGIRWSPDAEYLLGTEGSVTGNVPDTGLVRIRVTDGRVERFRPDSDGLPLSTPTFVGPQAVVLAIAGSLVGDQGDPLGRVVRYDLASGATTTLFWQEHLFPLQGVRADFTVVDVLRPGSLVFHRTAVRQTLRSFPLGSDDAGDSTALTRGQGRDRQPVFSRDGRFVAFSSNRSGNLDLWRLDLGTGELRQLTDDAAQDWDPAFTPDGGRILWSSDRSGHLEIWSANSDGSGATRLTDDGVDAENPTVTADGQWVVYWSANPDKLGVWKIRSDGTDATRLVEGPYLQPEVSPDGRHAAFVQIASDELRNRILVVDVETGQLVPFRIEVPTPLRAGSIIYGRVRWMPDGRALAFAGVDEQSRSGIFVQAFSPGEDTAATRRKLAGFSTEFVSESFGIAPDGRSIVVGAIEQTQQLMLAEGVAGVDRPL